MNKETYLRFLRAYLTGRLPAEEVEEILRYYTEYFEDAGQSREQDVIAELGSPEHLSRQILGERCQEGLVPFSEPAGESGAVLEGSPALRGGIPTWAYILLLIAAAIFVGPVLLGLVFGFGLAGLLCLLIGFGVAVGGLGRLSIFAMLYQGGGGLMAAAVGLLLLLVAIQSVRLTAKLLRWFRSKWVEGGIENEGSY